MDGRVFARAPPEPALVYSMPRSQITQVWIIARAIRYIPQALEDTSVRI
jgi:hypothetical protein